MKNNLNVQIMRRQARREKAFKEGIKKIMKDLLEESKKPIPESLFMDELYEPLVKLNFQKSLISLKLTEDLKNLKYELLRRRKCGKISLLAVHRP